MAGLNQVLLAIMMAIVVFAAVKGGGGPIAQAFENTAEIFGLDIGKPRIGSFTAVPVDSDGDNKFEMKFDVSIAGNKKDVILEIYESKASDAKEPDGSPAKVLKAPDPKFGPDDRIYTSEDTADKLVELAKTGVFSITCPTEEGCRSKVLKKPRSEFKPDWYKFSAVLKKKGKTVFQSDALVGFYDEAYVELLDKSLPGCNDDWGNCNVVQCKKKVINSNLFSGAGAPLETRRQSGLLREVSEDFRDEKELAEPGFKGRSNCGEVGDALGKVIKDDKDISASFFVLNGCSDKDVDDLNIKVARIRMLENAFQETGNVVNSEDKYKNYFNRLDDWKEEANKLTMSCTRTWDRFTTIKPKGALSEVARLGWHRIPETGGFDEWKNKVNTELDRVLRDELDPAIVNLRTEVGLSKAIALTWGALGYGNIDHYEVEHCWRKYARDRHFVSDAGGVELGGEESSCYPVDKRPSDVKFAIVPAGAPAGMHSFMLKAVKKDGGEITKELKAGFFVNNYIELYKGAYGYPNYKDKSKKGIITVCVRSPYATKDDNCDNDPNPDWGNLAECDISCDVFEKKRSAFRLKQVSNNDILFKDDVVVRVEAFDNWRKDKSTSCEYKKENAGFNTYNLELDGCSPEEVSQLYDALVRKAYPAEPWPGFYSCTPKKTGSEWEANWQKTNLNKFDVNHETVCKAKGELAKSLGNSNSKGGLEWAYFAS